MKAYNWDSNTALLSTSPVSRGSDVYGTHGATSSLSSNGSSDGILWEIEATNAENGASAILHAYDATNLGNELYESSATGGTQLDRRLSSASRRSPMVTRMLERRPSWTFTVCCHSSSKKLRRRALGPALTLLGTLLCGLFPGWFGNARLCCLGRTVHGNSVLPVRP